MLGLRQEKFRVLRVTSRISEDGCEEHSAICDRNRDDGLATILPPYTSYRIARLVIAFSASAPRAQLRPGYGDGLWRAPQLGHASLVQPGCVSVIDPSDTGGDHHRSDARVSVGKLGP
jgi:hypothetical protein